MTTQMSPTLTTQKLAWGYDNKPLAQNFDLQIMPGSMVAIVGPNGAGKTTLLQTFSGQLKPIEGRVLFGGIDIFQRDKNWCARKVATLSQTLNIDNDITVRELVELGRTPHLGLWGRLCEQDHTAIKQAITECQLEEYSHRRLGQLSGGEKQRARIAMAIAQHAPLLLLDEPSSHLDLHHRRDLFLLLKKLRKERQLTVVVVMHDLVEAFREANRVLLIAHGEISEISNDDSSRRNKLANAFSVSEDWIPL